MKTVLSLFLAAILIMSFLTVASADDVTESDYVFELDNAELSITLPEDYDNWTVIQDPASWFAISDGRDLITVDPLSDDDPEPEEELWGEWFEEVYQEYYSTEDETYVITGYVTDADEADPITDSVSSVQIQPYQDDQDDSDDLDDSDVPDDEADGYDVEELDIIGYCTEEDGTNVWSSPSTDDGLIGVLAYEEEVPVAGLVTEDGAGTGWICVDYDGMTGYIWGDFLSPSSPDQDVPDLADEAGAMNDSWSNEGKEAFAIFNDGWYVAKLWIQLRNDDDEIIDYYTDSCAIGSYSYKWVDIPDGYHIACLSLMIVDIAGWEDTGLYYMYENLDDPKLVGSYCFSKGTTFKQRFDSHQEFSAE